MYSYCRKMNKTLIISHFITFVHANIGIISYLLSIETSTVNSCRMIVRLRQIQSKIVAITTKEVDSKRPIGNFIFICCKQY